MKYIALTVLAFTLVSTIAFAAEAPSQNAASSPIGPTEDQKSYWEMARKNSEESHKRGLAYYDRVDKDLTSREEDIKRYEKILDTWERQQAEYQQYLDSLPTSPKQKK